MFVIFPDSKNITVYVQDYEGYYENVSPPPRGSGNNELARMGVVLMR